MKYKVPEVARYRILVSTLKCDKLPNCENNRVTENTEVQNLHGYGNHSRISEKQKIENYLSYRGVAEISAVKNVNKDRKNKKQKTQSYEVTGLRLLEIPEKQKSRGYENPRVTEQQENSKTKFRKLSLFVLFCFFFHLSLGYSSLRKKDIP